MTALALDGQTAVVTGAGRGLGRAIAIALADAGAGDVVLISRSRDELDGVAAEVRERGADARPMTCDLRDAAAIGALFDAVGDLDVLINNAGANVPEPFLDVTPRTFADLIGLNLGGVFYATQAAARAMLARGQPGAVVNISSQMGHVGATNRSVYCAAKHGVEGLTKALAVELAPHRIRVNAVAPTYVETPLTAPFFADPVLRTRAEAEIPLGRIARVDDITGAVVFLASPAAGMITGTSLVVDGGYTAR